MNTLARSASFPGAHPWKDIPKLCLPGPIKMIKEYGFAPTKGQRSKRQLSNLFTVANSHYRPI